MKLMSWPKFKVKMCLAQEYLSDLIQSYKPIWKLLLSNDEHKAMEPTTHLKTGGDRTF